MIKRYAVFLLLVLAGWGAPISGSLRADSPEAANKAVPPSAKMPEFLWNPKWEYPFWVSKEIALNERGELENKLFHPDRFNSLKELLAGPAIDGCYLMEEVYIEYVDRQPRGSLDKALESAELVVHGKVTGLADGFDTGLPATLIRFEALETAKGSSDLRDFYFAWPIANFSFMGKKVCKTDYRYAELPRIGDEVVVFTRQPVPETFPWLYIESPGDVIFLRSSRIDYPSTMTSDGEAAARNPTSRAQLLEKLGFSEHQP